MLVGMRAFRRESVPAPAGAVTRNAVANVDAKPAALTRTRGTAARRDVKSAAYRLSALATAAARLTYGAYWRRWRP